MDTVRRKTGICATAGIGTNLFLAKVAMDIIAKHVDSHIGLLTEKSFRKTLWHHRPITDIWNIGKGIARRLEKYGVLICMVSPFSPNPCSIRNLDVMPSSSLTMPGAENPARWPIFIPIIQNPTPCPTVRSYFQTILQKMPACLSMK